MKAFKPTNIFLTLFMAVTLFACKKEETKPAVDSRDAFVGTWKGVQANKFPSSFVNDYPDLVNLAEEREIISIITKATDTNKIIVSTDGIDLTAVVNSNSLVYDKKTLSVNHPDYGLIITELTGSGIKNGLSINETGIQKITVEGTTYTIQFTANLIKQ